MEIKSSDHDILVILHTKVDRVISDVRDINQNLAGRIAAVEISKLDAKEADRMLKEASVVHDDHEKRIRKIEKYVWLAIGGLATFDIIWKIAAAASKAG